MKKIAVALAFILTMFAFSACNSNNSAESTVTTQPATQKATEKSTEKPTKPTEKPTEKPTKPTEKPTFAAKVVKGEHATTSTDPTSGSDASTPVDDLSVDENGVGTITGRITGKGGLTFIIELPSGNKYEFSYADAEISDSENFATGNSVTVTYTGDIAGSDVGVASKIVVL